MRIRYAVFGAVISVVWGAIAIAGMTLGTTYNWPDFLHVNYGVPFTFATHTLSTIAGPVDSWTADLGSLATDLAFWLAGMVVIFLLSVLSESRRRGMPASSGTSLGQS